MRMIQKNTLLMILTAMLVSACNAKENTVIAVVTADEANKISVAEEIRNFDGFGSRLIACADDPKSDECTGKNTNDTTINTASRPAKKANKKMSDKEWLDMYGEYQQEIVRMYKERDFGTHFNLVDSIDTGMRLFQTEQMNIKDLKDYLIHCIEIFTELEKGWAMNHYPATMRKEEREKRIAKGEMYEYMSGTVLPAIKGE